ncbi:10223_t:CDS:2 [Gigaspora rosea]|nr:10223_t:CDS:2 [Gigaspora rosea]
MILTNLDPDRSNPDKLETDEWKNKYGSFHSSSHVFITRIVTNKELNKNENVKNYVPNGIVGNVSIAVKNPNGIAHDTLALKDKLERVYPAGEDDG